MFNNCSFFLKRLTNILTSLLSLYTYLSHGIYHAASQCMTRCWSWLCWTAFPTVPFSVCCWLAWATQTLKPDLKNASTTAATLSFTHTVTDPQVPLIAGIIAQACKSTFPWGSSLSFSTSWTIVCNLTPWKGPPVLQESHPTKVRGGKNLHTFQLILLGSTSLSWVPASSFSPTLHLQSHLLPLTACPKGFKLQHQMWRQWPQARCLTNSHNCTRPNLCTRSLHRSLWISM